VTFCHAHLSGTTLLCDVAFGISCFLHQRASSPLVSFCRGGVGCFRERLVIPGRFLDFYCGPAAGMTRRYERFFRPSDAYLALAEEIFSFLLVCVRTLLIELSRVSLRPLLCASWYFRIARTFPNFLVLLKTPTLWGSVPVSFSSKVESFFFSWRRLSAWSPTAPTRWIRLDFPRRPALFFLPEGGLLLRMRGTSFPPFWSAAMRP